MICQLPDIAPLALVTVLIAGTAQGSVVLSNLDSPDNEFESVGWNPDAGGLAIGSHVAFQFTAGSDVLLTSMAVRLGRSTVASVGTGFGVTVATDQGGLPGGTIGTLDGDVAPLTPGFYTYSAQSSVLLSSGSSYWFVLTVPYGSGATLSSFSPIVTQSTSSLGDPGWSIGAVAEQLYLNDSVFIPWSTAFSTGYRGIFEIKATVIPAPGAAVILTAGVLFPTRRRR